MITATVRTFRRLPRKKKTIGRRAAAFFCLMNPGFHMIEARGGDGDGIVAEMREDSKQAEYDEGSIWCSQVLKKVPNTLGLRWKV